MKRKLFFATLVATMLVVGTVASAASKNYSSWFDLDRINAIDVEEDLTEEATREEVALLLADICDSFEALPSRATLDFYDDDDFDSSKSYKIVTRLTSTGIVAGYPDGSFGPENDITRAEALAMVLRTVDYLALETESYRRGASFTDMEGHWAEVSVERAYEHGLVSGRGNGRFYPDDDITREEIITILVNLLGESNNPLIGAIDLIYGLEFDNQYYSSRYEDDDDYYDRYSSRYDDDDDYEDLIKRPVVDTGSSSSNSSSNNGYSNNKRPERPVVDTTSTGTNTSTSNGNKPERPVVDTTTNNSTSSVERPTVDVDSSEIVSSSKPARPTV